jgi:hypothetical protein
MEQNAYTVGQENFNLPHDVVTLPSGGVFYKSKKKSVKVGYLTASDENFLLSTGRLGSGGIVMSLLRNKLYEHDLRPEELLEGDVEAILVYLRNTSFGPEYSINLVDPVSGKKFQHEVILDELNIKTTPNKPDEDGLFTTKLPKSGTTVKLRLLTYADIYDLDKMAEQYPENMVAPKITWRLNKQIVEVNGTNNREEIAKFIETMPIMDSKYIRNFLKENQPSLDLRKTALAPSGEMVSFEITFGVEFFRPFF